MMFRTKLAAWWGAALCLWLAPGCGSSAMDTGEITAGVTSDISVSRLEVQTRIGDKSADDTLSNPLFPLEVGASRVVDGQTVGFTLTAFDADGQEILSRRAETKGIGGDKLLLPIHLEAACSISNGGPQCGEEQTCIGGTCQSPSVDPSSLEPYEPNWAGGTGGGGNTDLCKAADSEPLVFIGRGQSDYLALEDEEVVQVEAGPQGGYHIWIAIRQQGLLRSGSVTSISGYVPELSLDIAPFNVIFTFDQDEGGFCKLYGLRFRLDSEDTLIESLLGKPVDLSVTVTDPDGDVGVGQQTVVLSDAVL